MTQSQRRRPTRAEYAAARSAIVGLAEQLLLGPITPDETVTSPPLDTYLTGILWPEGEQLAAMEDENGDGAPVAADDGSDVAVPGYRSIRPCSIGITFAVDSDAEVVVSLGGTARYAAVELEPRVEGGRPVRAWRRALLGYSLVLQPGPAGRWNHSAFVRADGTAVEDDDVRIHVRRRLNGGQQVLTVTLVNSAREADDTTRDELCLLQAEIVVACTSGARHFRPRPSPVQAGGDEDAESAALLYRHAVEFAVGHGVAAAWDDVEGDRAGAVRTDWLPRAHVRGMSAEGHPTLADFLEDHPHAFEAAWLGGGGDRDAVIGALDAFIDSYERWIAALSGRLDAFGGLLHSAAGRNVERCSTAASRMRLGVRTLAADDDAWRAFVLANLAMDRQSDFPVKKERQGPLVWRPFQLAYLLLVLPGLARPDDAEAERDCMDLLWFPTGGGKTEAYLALTAFEIFLRRLTDGARRAMGGVDVLMRYTLRLLTVQQFQRAASLICACDALRRERGDLGDAPISLGLYVGDEATPNRTEKALAALVEERDGLAPRSTPRQLLDCPVCGVALPPSGYAATADDTAIEIRCANAQCATAGQLIPVVTVDEIIYRHPPSLLIGTIDKFAQLPKRKDLRSLFALDGGAPPGLIIQDELHLISGPLGSMAGLYETVIDLICTRDSRRPKVIGSTATIGQAARQVRALFDRPVLQFPPSGFEADDSFFAVTDTTGPDRLYIGISSAGRSPKFALQAVAAALLEAAKVVRDAGAGAAVDPFWTCVLYFNSLRELGGAHVLMQDDVPRQMEFVAGRLAAGAPRLLEHEPVELSSRVPSRDLPEKLARLAVDAGQALADPFAATPEDTVLASNMISVGVDVPRLGLMVVNGQPKSTAEYIQASSRVGRGVPGIVATMYNFGRPRDVSHFEHFAGYHAALYRSVEATSVTPWAPRARDKALHAVVAAAVRHLIAGMDDDGDALDFDAADPAVGELIDAVVRRAGSSSDGVEAADTATALRAIVREWAQRSSDTRAAGKRLLYWERRAPFGATLPHLMTSAESGARSTGLAWPTPNSMREVEPSTAFSLKRFQDR